MPARVWTHGQVRETTLPRGLDVRPTAAPYFLTPATAVGASPLAGLDVEEGGWLVVAEAPGRERVLHPIWIKPGAVHTTVTLVLPPAGETPPGFVHVDIQPPTGMATVLDKLRKNPKRSTTLFRDVPATSIDIAARKE